MYRHLFRRVINLSKVTLLTVRQFIRLLRIWVRMFIVQLHVVIVVGGLFLHPARRFELSVCQMLILCAYLS